MDPIAAMFAQIKNTVLAGKESLEIPSSHLKRAILIILQEKGIISSSKDKNNKTIEIKINHNFAKFNRLSRPGRRIYTKNKDIPRPKSPNNILIISTSEGIMDGETARKKGLGGELIVEVL